jgi:hypothetical protein
VDVELVRFAIEELAGCTVPADLEECLAKLTETGVLAREGPANHYSVPATGVGPLLSVLFTESHAVGAIRAACKQRFKKRLAFLRRCQLSGRLYLCLLAKHERVPHRGQVNCSKGQSTTSTPGE